MRRHPRRMLRRLRYRAQHAARHHYMFAVTLLLLVAAGAASLGAFSKHDDELQLERRVVAVPQPATRPAVPVNAPQAPRLIMTYFIVDTQATLESFAMMKSELRHREWLERNAFEVVMARTPEELTQAYRAIDEARQQCVCAEFHVEDARQRRAATSTAP